MIKIKKITLQEWLPIKEIDKEGVVKLKNNKLIKIIKVNPINYNLKSDLEKESIISRNNTFNVSLLTDAIPMHKFEYDGVLIEEIEYCKYGLNILSNENLKNSYVYCFQSTHLWFFHEPIRIILLSLNSLYSC